MNIFFILFIYAFIIEAYDCFHDMNKIRRYTAKLEQNETAIPDELNQRFILRTLRFGIACMAIILLLYFLLVGNGG